MRGHPSGGRLAIIELREIACDESGYEGESLVGGVTDVFAHAGVHLTSTAAAGCVEQLRRRIRSPALEYQANHLLREKNRRALEWLLGVDGPIHGHAHVHLVDKTLFLIGKIVELVGGNYEETLDLHRNRLDPAVLAAANDLLRPRTRQGEPTRVHDRQTSLTPDRLAALMARNGAPASLRFVDSRTDARVQVADFLAGVARRAASEEPAGRCDAALLGLLRPYVDPASIWDGVIGGSRRPAPAPPR